MTRNSVAVNGVWLTKRRNDKGLDEVVVSIEVDGIWRRCVVELVDGPISHCVEPGGIRHAPIDDYLVVDRP